MNNNTIVGLLTCMIFLSFLPEAQSQDQEHFIPFYREPIALKAPVKGTSRESLVNFKIEATVKSIGDGDTLTLIGKNQAEFIIRMSDIDTPEVEHDEFTPYSCSCKTIPFRPGQRGGKDATEALKELVTIGDHVSAECYEIDIYGRIVCHVFNNGVNLNLEMIKNGWGWLPNNNAWIRDPQSYKEESLAEEGKKGAWGLPGQVSPKKWRTDCWKNGKCNQAASETKVNNIAFIVQNENFSPYVYKSKFSLPVGTLKFDVLPDGQIIALGGDKIYVENSVGSRTYREVGKIPGLNIGPYGPAFFRVSPNATLFAVGDNNGNIGIFNTTTLKGKWFSINHFDAEWYDNDSLAITKGKFGERSQVDILNVNSAPFKMQLTCIINNIGGASAGISFDQNGNLFTGNGFKTVGPSGTGTIKYFSVTDWKKALTDNISLNFETDGIFIIDILSANSLGFDNAGNMFVGGSDKFGDGIDINFSAITKKDAIKKAITENAPIDPSDSKVLCRLDPETQDATSEYSIIFNAKTNELYLKSGPFVYVYQSLLNDVSFIQKSFKKTSSLRVVSLNTNGNFISNSRCDESFNRILSSISPDIIVFQEIVSSIKPKISKRLGDILGDNWYILSGLKSGIYQNVVASRYPLLLSSKDTVPSAGIRGVTAALIDLPESKYTKDIYIMGVHFQCCDSDAYKKERQRAADAIISWLADAKEPGNNISLPYDTPIIIAGDINITSDSQTMITLLTGNIIDELNYGHDIQPDWDNSTLTDLIPKDIKNGNINTWPSNSSDPIKRYDRIIFSDSAVKVNAGFILNTLNLDNEELNVLELKKTDTSSISDHLPIIVDLQLL